LILKVFPAKGIKGTLEVPGDKSISHRAIMFGSIAEGITEIEGFLFSDDCTRTIECFRSIGSDIEIKEKRILIKGNGLRGFKKSNGVLYVGNSGTTIRLMSGILAGQPFETVLTGDSSILKRPMKRIIEPLKLMGAEIYGQNNDNYPPLWIRGGVLKGIKYRLPVASAQVKSAIIFASLYAEGETEIMEPIESRNHTEIMLKIFGGSIDKDGTKIFIRPSSKLVGQKLKIPGDISSAAYFIVASLILPDSEVTIKNVGLNPTRTGIIEILKKMGADIEIKNERIVNGEKVGDVTSRSSQLKGINIEGNIIPKLIDEIPILAVAAAFAEGMTVIRNAEELKVKESNRIKAMVTELKKMGAKIEELEDGMIIYGRNSLRGNLLEGYKDHRIVMSLAVAALAAQGETEIKDAEYTETSFPEFERKLREVVF